MSLTMRTHEVKVNRMGQAELLRENLYLKLVERDEVPIFLQHGQAYFADGVVVTEMPTWAIKSVQSMSPLGLKQVGWTVEMAQGLSISPALNFKAPGKITPADLEVAPPQPLDDVELLEAQMIALQKQRATLLAQRGGMPTEHEMLPPPAAVKTRAPRAAPAPEVVEEGPMEDPELNPLTMRFFTLKAWGKRNGLVATTREEILTEARERGLI